MNSIPRFLTLSAALAAVAPVSAQTIVNPGVIERPVVQTVRVRTTVSAPANVFVPPPLVPQAEGMRAFEKAQQGLLQEMRRLRFTYLHERRNDDLKLQGFAKMAAYTAQEAVEPLIETLREDRAEVRDWLVEHLATRVEGEIGQAALTYLALYDEDGDLRRRASDALAQTAPANSYSRMHLTLAIRSEDPTIFERAAYVSRELELVEAIPYFIAHIGNGRYQRTEKGPMMLRSGNFFAFKSELDREAVLGETGFPLAAIQEYEDHRARIVEYQRDVRQVDQVRFDGGSIRTSGSTLHGIRRVYTGPPEENPSACPYTLIPVPPVSGEEGVSASELMGDLAATTFVVEHALAALAAKVSPDEAPVNFGHDFGSWARWYNEVALPALQTTADPNLTTPAADLAQP